MDQLEDIRTAVEELSATAGERLDAQADEIKALKSELEAQETAPSPGRGRITEPDELPGDAPSRETQSRRQARPRARVLGPTARHSETFGFTHFGDFAASVRNAGMPGGETDGRLMAAAASTFGNEGSGSDGGFAIPPDFRAQIEAKVFGEDSLLARTMQVPVSGNSLTFPSSMATAWGTTGVQARWTAEAAVITQDKPVIQEVTVKLNKLSVLVPVSEELLEDAVAMGVLVSRLAADAIDFKVSDAIANGNGAGQPLGYMNSAVLISQAKETAQVADTIVAANISKMSSRLPVQMRRNAIWLIHPDAEPLLSLMTLGDQPIFLPPGGMRDTPFGRLLGRPVIPHQVCQTVGDLGDIMLVDLTQYLTAVKSGGVRAETSIHLWFDQSITAFRFIFRIAGQPWWSEVTTAANGSFTQSPFISLAERA